MLLVLLLFISVDSFAANKFLNKKNIIDIGHNAESNEIEVPKQEIIKEPNIKSIENIIVYEKRIQSEKFDCQTDFLNTETCPEEQNICPSNVEYVNGFSTAHKVSKKYLKICDSSQIKDGDRCYYDGNKDGIKDSAHLIKSGGYVWRNYFLNHENFVRKESSVNINPYGYIEVRHFSNEACDDDDNHVLVKINTVEKINVSCGVSKDTGYRKVYKNTSSSMKSVNYLLQDSHSGGGYDNSNMQMYIYNYSISVPSGYSIEEDTGNYYFYKDGYCPNGSIEQSDGSCLLEYYWYSYSCPSELNEYGIAWNVINSGFDCGNSSCTNSPIPPENNCVRIRYSCPFDSTVKCGKTENKIDFCQDGYVMNNGICERIESYCGDSFYNSVLDVCQNITKYNKLCGDENEQYDPSKNLCISSNVACENGTYSSEYNNCLMDFVPVCNTEGYIYNKVSGICEKADAAICEEQYNYDQESGKCVGEMSLCPTGLTYNSSTKKCEQLVCTVLNTSNDGIKCETSVLCDGTLTSNGTCIPSSIK
jgi:hypothetical protein